MHAGRSRAQVSRHIARARTSTGLMRHSLALTVVLAACSGGDNNHHLPPETAIDDKPAALTNQTHARITFHADGVANRFACQLDGNTPSECISPFEADVSDGDHTFSVAAALNNTVDDSPAT